MTPRDMTGPYLLPPISIQDGLVAHSNPFILFPPNMTFGMGCWGNVAVAGSDGPGNRVIGSEESRISLRWSDKVFVGCEAKRGLTVVLKRFYTRSDCAFGGVS